MIMHLARNILHLVSDLVYPPRCPICHAFVSARDKACLACDNSMIRIETDAHLELPGRIYLSRARSCFAYDGCVRDLIHSFKYGFRLDCERFLAKAIMEKARAMGEFDFITTVPAQKSRMISRGLDACALLARRLSKEMGIPFKSNILSRQRSVEPQVGLQRTERMKNVRGLFGIFQGRESHINDTTILLIDDVMTTGATANDCARALIKAGAKNVEALTIARAL